MEIYCKKNLGSKVKANKLMSWDLKGFVGLRLWPLKIWSLEEKFLINKGQQEKD